MNETGVDVLAPAVGNMHGLLEGMVAGGRNTKRSESSGSAEIKKAIDGIVHDAPRRLGNGGRGFRRRGQSRHDNHARFERAPPSLAPRREAGLKDPNEIAPYKIMAPAVEGIKAVVMDRLKLFNGI